MREAAGDTQRALSAAALAVGILGVLGTADYRHLQPATLILFATGLGVGGALLGRLRPGPALTMLYVAAVGIVNRAGRHAFNGSDVIGVTREAIALVTRGGNPYQHIYQYSNPAGSPFPYLPGEIAWYAIPHLLVHQIVGTDKWAGIGIVLALACLAPVAGSGAAAVGTAIYATFLPVVLRSLDGSNDTSLALLVVAATVLLAAGERRGPPAAFYASAAVFGWAIAFKEFAWLIYPFVIAHLRRRGALWQPYTAISLAVAGAMILPFFITAPGGMIRNVIAGVTFHHAVFGVDVWSVVDRYAWGRRLATAAPAFMVAAVAATGIPFLARPSRRLGTTLGQGTAVLFAALLFARYATASYYMAGVAMLCVALILYLGDTYQSSGSMKISTSPPQDSPTVNAISSLMP